MKCIYCFLSDYYQNDLKRKAQFDQCRFENALDNYKNLFISEIHRLTNVKRCECKHHFIPLANKLVSDLAVDVNGNIKYIESLFNEIISIYLAFAKANHIQAHKYLVEYLKKCTGYSVSNSHDFCKPLFRIRHKPNDNSLYDPFDENEYFHIPFSKRHLVGNQRYSISGLPMCYLASNLQTALNEIEKDIDDVNIALFMPRYSDFYHMGVFDVTNALFENLRVSINMINSGSILYYNDRFDNCLKKRIKCLLAEYVLYQVLQFPVNPDNKGTFIAEYVLPQLLMEEVQKNSKWVGVKYQSTKSIRDNTGITDFINNENYCFVVPYEANGDYSETFKEQFFIVLETKTRKAHIAEIRKELVRYKQLCDENEKDGFFMNEYRMYAARIKLFMDTEEGLYINKKLEYRVYQAEINLLFHLLLELETIILEPDKNGIIKTFVPPREN